MARVLVLGAGAVGTLVAANLAADPQVRVTVAVRPGIGSLSFTTNGATAPLDVTLVTSPAQLDPVDWVVVCTKSYDVAGLPDWLTAPACATASVAVAQSGIDLADRLSGVALSGPVLPMIVTYGAHRPAPGEVVQRHDGVVRVPSDEMGHAFAAVAAGGGLSVEVVDDFDAAAWARLGWDLAGGSLSTITQLPLREVGRRPELQAVARALILELTTVARGEGVRLAPDLADATLEALAACPRLARGPMLDDRDAGRPFEHLSIGGAVLAAADRQSLDLPHTRTVMALLEALSPRRRRSTTRQVPVPALPRVWCAPTSDLSSR